MYCLSENKDSQKRQQLFIENLQVLLMTLPRYRLVTHELSTIRRVQGNKSKLH